MTVLSKGTERGDRGKIPLGGHVRPISTVGERKASKKAQKKLKKKHTSLRIKRRNAARRDTSSL
jgi:hypothetical protein